MERILNRRGIVGEPGESYEDFAKRVEVGVSPFCGGVGSGVSVTASLVG